MPEGDTIFRAARTLAARLSGREVLAFELADRPRGALLARPDRVGRQITAVEARGKNLLVTFDDLAVLHTHMRMTGSWHVYRPGEAWQKPVSYARVRIEVEGTVAVCFSAPVVELATRAPALRLGPDLLTADFDLEAAVAAMMAEGAMPIGESVMRQRLVAGIGNVYKSESLFVCRLSPFLTVREVGVERLTALLIEARRLMRANVAPGSGMRTTRPGIGPRAWVYGRSGKPCLVCGTGIRMRRQGIDARSTYFCPHCQACDVASSGSTWNAPRPSSARSGKSSRTSR